MPAHTAAAGIAPVTGTPITAAAIDAPHAINREYPAEIAQRSHRFWDEADGA